MANENASLFCSLVVFNTRPNGCSLKAVFYCRFASSILLLSGYKHTKALEAKVKTNRTQNNVTLQNRLNEERHVAS